MGKSDVEADPADEVFGMAVRIANSQSQNAEIVGE